MIRRLKRIRITPRKAALLVVCAMLAASVPVEPGIDPLLQRLLAGGMACFLALFFTR
jgi:hypothetical protein